MAEVTMPQLGETVTEGTITRWFKAVGDRIEADEVLFEVSTDKVDSEVPSPVGGTITEIRVPEGDVVEVGAVLAVVSERDVTDVSPTPSRPAPDADAPAPAPGASGADQPAPATAPEPATPSAATPESPAVAGSGVEIRLPQLGETVTEGTITRWFKAVGDRIEADEVLFEVSTDKVDSEVPSPVGGTITEIRVPEGDVVEVDTVLAIVSSGAAPEPDAAPPADEPPASVERTDDAARPTQPSADEPTNAAAAAPAPRADTAELPLSPVVRRLVSQSGIDPTTITGTGLGGRITRGDVEAAIAASGGSTTAAVSGGSAVAATPPTPAPAQPVAPSASAPSSPPPSGSPSPDASRSPTTGSQRVPMNNIRRITGEYMVDSKRTSPHVLTAVEVDFEAVERVRRAHRRSWKADEGFSLTYLPFIARALVDAVREFPHINASVDDGALIVHEQVNLAIAVDLDFEGLLAPVVKAADTKRLRALSREIVDLAGRARSKRLSADEITGGTFTITNPGQYGTLMQFPIINQPQVAILSTDGVRRKPVVVTDDFGNESIGIHSVGILALAWDHRAFDGAYVAAFLDHLRTIIETRDWESELS